VDLRNLVASPNPTWPVVCLRWALRLASLPYWAATAARNLAFDLRLKKTFRSPLKVISIGNLTVGGTGKTPAVVWFARQLRHRDLRVAILSRGYGQLDSGQNDEALELELLLPDVPHLQHWDRIASAKLAEAELDMQILLLDDGFQHRRLARDLDVVLIDTSDDDAAMHLLPGGLLRESLNGLRRAHLVLLTRCNQAKPERVQAWKDRVHRSNPNVAVALAEHRPARIEVFPSQAMELDTLRGKNVLAFCGIGNPKSFFDSLELLGAEILDRRTWPDHFAYRAEDVQQLANWANQFPTAEWMMCTRKDWVKLQTARISRLPLGALVVDLAITEGREAIERLLVGLEPGM
jgi:tetraacyldisaccharide 4'-kinase